MALLASLRAAEDVPDLVNDTLVAIDRDLEVLAAATATGLLPEEEMARIVIFIDEVRRARGRLRLEIHAPT